MGAQWLSSSKESIDQICLSLKSMYRSMMTIVHMLSHKIDTDSVQLELFTIYQGKLYLNYSATVNTKMDRA